MNNISMFDDSALFQPFSVWWCLISKIHFFLSLDQQYIYLTKTIIGNLKFCSHLTNVLQIKIQLSKKKKEIK